MEHEVEGLMELEESGGPTELEMQIGAEPAGLGLVRAVRGANGRARRRRP